MDLRGGAPSAGKPIVEVASKDVGEFLRLAKAQRPARNDHFHGMRAWARIGQRYDLLLLAHCSAA
jgi:hypothetical protein